MKRNSFYNDRKDLEKFFINRVYIDLYFKYKAIFILIQLKIKGSLENV